ncbi:MAG TPA: sigma-70 family RNA polymerase sigma factor [Chitinophagaceae bacterium]|jgi:RNA polymerase sigma-70 factor (ECF subfamily)|nr:sigma-70 family RNA polymerase sigma factor [Chitinophagaceae bacterium]
MHTGITDTDIISLVLKGDQQAYAMLVKRYQNFVFTVVLRYLKNREDAEEVAQDIFVKAYRSLADFKGTAKFSTWLYTITTTSSITFLRRKKIEIHSLDNEKVFAIADTISAVISSNGVEQKSRAMLINKAINFLNEDDALLITLFYKGEQTLEEIAQILGIEKNTVKVRLHRARTKLKERLQQHFSAEVKDI